MSESMSEIERLKADNIDLQTCLDASVFTYNQADAECSRLRTLCARAADALEGKPVYDALANYNLIAELREAAK